MRWTDATVREALGHVEVRGTAPAASFESISTDTRTLEPGALFVALAGERFDAHGFLDDAAGRGARGAVVARLPDTAPPGLVYYRVDDTLAALGRLARHRRRRLDARVCAITGTNGKTTTKEMARAVLATRHRVHATEGNLNNLVGTPLTLLAAPDDAEALVVEVGTNAPGEIARLGEIVEPDAAIVTGVGEGHLEGLGDFEGVLREKTSLFDALGAAATGFVADEPPELAERAGARVADLRVAGWSDRADPDLRAEAVSLDADGRVRFRWRGREVRLEFRGRPNARNALLALGLAEAWGVDPDEGVEALASVRPTALRTEVHRYGELTVVADCYNANPASTEAAIDLLVSLPRGGGRVAVVGTMKELGERSAALHRRLAETLAGSDVDTVVATGEFASAFAGLADRLGDRLIASEDPLEACERLRPRLRGDEVVLLKGSRGVSLERLLPVLERVGRGRGGGGPAQGSDGRGGRHRGDGAPDDAWATGE
ncbi:MAG: UDP-N-acetylmuramoyl-tripeptide--D-alanyl-D-alanine ligase [Gemmatimonadota bacterium]